MQTGSPSPIHKRYHTNQTPNVSEPVRFLLQANYVKRDRTGFRNPAHLPCDTIINKGLSVRTVTKLECRWPPIGKFVNEAAQTVFAVQPSSSLMVSSALGPTCLKHTETNSCQNILIFEICAKRARTSASFILLPVCPLWRIFLTSYSKHDSIGSEMCNIPSVDSRTLLTKILTLLMPSKNTNLVNVGWISQQRNSFSR